MSITTYDKEIKSKRSYELKFTNKSMKGVDTPHNDALVITVNINTFDVKRVLIDPKSSSEIMYHNMFKKLKLPPSQVKNADSPIFSFIEEVVWPPPSTKSLNSRVMKGLWLSEEIKKMHATTSANGAKCYRAKCPTELAESL